MTTTPDMDCELAECLALFRNETEDGSSDGFDRSAQLRLTSGILAYLRNKHLDLWQRIHETRGIGPLNDHDHRGVREFKTQLENPIRAADESRDHLWTVSFVSRSVLQKIREISGGRPKVRHLSSEEFAHEHGVPVDAIIRTIVHPKNGSVDLYEVLGAMSCRSLLLKHEAAAVDVRFKSSLAGWVNTPWGSYPSGSLPLRHLALARYYAALPKLLDELIPTSKRAATMLAEFRELVKGSGSVTNTVEYMERTMRHHEALPIAYIPDYVFDWGRT